MVLIYSDKFRTKPMSTRVVSPLTLEVGETLGGFNPKKSATTEFTPSHPITTCRVITPKKKKQRGNVNH